MPGYDTNQFVQVWKNQANWNNAISRKPRKTGYMFDGFWTAPNGGKQVWDADMKYVSGTGYWSEDGSEEKRAGQETLPPQMEELLENDAALLNKYKAIKAKHNRQSAANILPILMEKGLVESSSK